MLPPARASAAELRGRIRWSGRRYASLAAVRAIQWRERTAGVRSAARIVMSEACAVCMTPGWTQNHPAKPVRIVV